MEPGADAFWSVEVTELLSIFREALRAVAPVVKKAHINYEEAVAYDDWDSIAQCLYTNVVERSIQSARGLDAGGELPKYAMIYETYTHNTLVLMREPGAGATRPMVFHSFITRGELFDTVLGIELSNAYEAMLSSRHEASVIRTTFTLLLRRGDETRTIDHLDVRL